MDFTSIGSLTNYTKTMKLKNDWNKKKRENDLGSQSKKSELERKNDMFKADYKKQQEEHKADKMLQNINSKLAAGTDLTPAEMLYLRTKDPNKYQELKNQEREKKNYERELKNCKTKEEVQRLKMSVVGSALSSINAVKSNPNIPDSAKLAVAQRELRKLDEYKKVDAEFAKSGELSKLPTEEEVRQVEKDKTEAREAEIEKLYESAKELVADMEKDIKPEETDAVADESKANTEAETVSDTENDTLLKEIVAEQQDKRPTETEAEYSPEAKKVKRAKARAAYNESKNAIKNSNAVLFATFKSKTPIK